MSVQQLKSMKNWILQQHFLVPDEWISSAADWLKTEHNQNEFSDAELRQLIIEQYLHADLRDFEIGAISGRIQSSAWFSGTITLQLNAIQDVSQSCFSQLKKLRGDDVSNSEVVQNPEAWKDKEPKGNRMLLLTLSDGVSEIKALEYQTIRELHLELSLGAKIRLRGPIFCRRGILLLSSSKNIEILGGMVDELVSQNSQLNLLSNALARLGHQPLPPPVNPTTAPPRAAAPNTTSASTNQEVSALQAPPVPVNSSVDAFDDMDDDDLLLQAVENVPLPPEPVPITGSSSAVVRMSASPRRSIATNRVRDPDKSSRVSVSRPISRVPANTRCRIDSENDIVAASSHPSTPVTESSSIQRPLKRLNVVEPMASHPEKRSSIESVPPVTSNLTCGNILSASVNPKSRLDPSLDSFSSKSSATNSSMFPVHEFYPMQSSSPYSSTRQNLTQQMQKSESMKSSVNQSSNILTSVPKWTTCMSSPVQHSENLDSTSLQSRVLESSSLQSRALESSSLQSRALESTSIQSDAPPSSSCSLTAKPLYESKNQTSLSSEFGFHYLIDIIHEVSNVESSRIRGSSKTFLVKGFFLTALSRLESSSGIWSMKARLTDGTASVDCVLHNDFVAKLIGFSATEAHRLKNLSKTDSGVKSKLVAAISHLQNSLANLSGLFTMEVDLASSDCTVLDFYEASQSHVEYLAQRLSC